MNSFAYIDAVPAEHLGAAAGRLLGRPVDALIPVRSGGNNRVYRLLAGGVNYAVKCSPMQDLDRRDRLAREFEALDFLISQGVQSVPRPVACDWQAGLGIYEWVEGSRFGTPRLEDVDHFLEFVEHLQGIATRPGAEDLPVASAACLSLAEAENQLLSRRARLSEAAMRDEAIARFLLECFDPAMRQCLDRFQAALQVAGIDRDGRLPHESRCLSPSDFGLHNALRQADGGITFLDFEYFGWDDPAKLTADFLLHPGHSLSVVQRRHFANGMRRLWARDPSFCGRLKALYPLLGLCWVMIILNDFLPERFARRVFAQGETHALSARHAQLAKARTLLDQLRDPDEAAALLD